MAPMDIVYRLLLFIHCCSAMIAYNCWKDPVSVKELSLTDLQDCNYHNKSVVKSPITIQMIQQKDFDLLPYVQCHVEILQTIHYCGMHSHLSGNTDMVRSYVEMVSESQCRDMHNTKVYKPSSETTMSDLKVNGSVSAAFNIYGSYYSNDKCTGTTFTWAGKRYDSHVLARQITIRLRTGVAIVHRKQNRIAIPQGPTCVLQEESCIDELRGNTFWKVTDNLRECSQTSYDVLYQGRATLTRYQNTSLEGSAITIKDGSYIVSFKIVRIDTVCRVQVYVTEHPEIYFVVPDVSGHFWFKNVSVLPLNINNFRYTNSKFAYLEVFMADSINNVLAHIEFEQCKAKAEGYRTLQSLAYINEEAFAYSFTGRPGFTASISGEIAYIIECPAVEVHHRPIEGHCYQELPVQLNISGTIEKYFRRPRTGILTRVGTEIDCSSQYPPKFKIGGRWYNALSNMILTTAPTILDPNIAVHFILQPILNLVEAGIYTPQQMADSFRFSIMGPETGAITSIITRGSLGVPSYNSQNINFGTLVPEDVVDGWFTKKFNEMYGFFSGIGQIMNFVVGLMTCVGIVVYLVSVGINFYSLYKEFGMDRRLFACVYTPFTHGLLHHTVRQERKIIHQTFLRLTPKPNPRPAPEPPKRESEEHVYFHPEP